MTAQAPSLHAELQKQIAGSQVRASTATLSLLYLFLDTILSPDKACSLRTVHGVLGGTKGASFWHSIIAFLIVAVEWCSGNVTPVLHLIQVLHSSPSETCAYQPLQPILALAVLAISWCMSIISKDMDCMQMSEMPMGGGGASNKKKNSTDIWYDVAGWVLLGGIMFGWVSLARNTPAPSPALK